MLMIYPNPSGWGTKREWVKRKEPDVYPENGLAHLAPYVERVLASTAWYTNLAVFDREGDRGFGLDKVDGLLTIDLSFGWGPWDDGEERARAIFAARGIKPTQDELEPRGKGECPLRALTWPLPANAEDATGICRTVLIDVFGITDEEGLEISFEETPNRPF